MSALIQKEKAIFNRVLVLLVTLAVVTVSGCLGLLWLRQKIELTAQTTRSLEEDITKEQRRLRYLDTKIAEIHQPLYLERQIGRLNLNLRPPGADRIVYMDGFRGRYKGLARQSDTGPAPRERDPYRRSIDLAVMESFYPVD